MNWTADILERAGRLLKDGTAWGVVPLAVTKAGKTCCPTSARATKWCAIGAVLKEGGAPARAVAEFPHTMKALAALDQAASLEFRATSIRVNDELGHAAVMRMYRRAWFDISRAETGRKQHDDAA